jgi:TetR/AcrR family transcriptional regulator, regulator of autoinduction and epiphytic fitness
MQANAISETSEAILHAAITVFGRYGFKKTSMETIAGEAGLSKQALYLHFESKQDIFLQATRLYLDEGLVLVDEALRREGGLFLRIHGAMDAWFGRHFVTYSQQSFDVIPTGDKISQGGVEKYKEAFQAKLAKAIASAPDYRGSRAPREVAQALFTCGLTWKERHASRADFLKTMAVCVRVCCQIQN